jgi:hypothetical protein
VRLINWHTVALLGALLAGCERATPTAPAAPTPPAGLERYYATPGVVWTPDDEMARIAREEIPGFAGYFVNPSGKATMLLKDVRTKGAAVANFRRIMGHLKFADGRGPDLDRMDVAPARYDFNQLQTWRLALREPVFDDHGSVSLDIDETQDRIVVGVVNHAAGQRMTQIFDQLHIPRDAATTQVTPITCSLSTGCPAPDTGSTGGGVAPVDPVYDDVITARPGRLDGDAGTIIAGYEIYHDLDPNTHRAPTCTLGVNADVDFSNGTLSGFFTNSHCTKQMFASDGTEFFQGVQDAGYEGWDRGTFDYNSNQACWVMQQCRYSDAAFVKYNTTTYFQRGYIAKTSQQSTFGVANKVVSGRYRIVTWYSPPVAPPYYGQQLVKVGRTTGETTGRVVQTCLDLSNTYQTSYRLLCQYQVANSWADGGDSGSPVFWVSSGTDVWFYGLLWGSPNGVPTSYYFSGWYELVWGDMKTYPSHVRIQA